MLKFLISIFDPNLHDTVVAKWCLKPERIVSPLQVSNLFSRVALKRTHNVARCAGWCTTSARRREIIFLSLCASSPVCIMSTRPRCVLHDGEHGVLRGKNPRYASNADFNLARSASLGAHTVSQSSSKLRAYPCRLCDFAGAAGATYLHTHTHTSSPAAAQRIQVHVSAHEHCEFLQSKELMNCSRSLVNII